MSEEQVCVVQWQINWDSNDNQRHEDAHKLAGSQTEPDAEC